MSSLWLTSLAKDQETIAAMMAQFKTYGIQIQGHFWENDNAKIAWLGAVDSLMDKEMAMWAIMGSQADLQNGDIRYGLSMVALCLQARRGTGFPIVILQSDGTPISGAQLPTPLSKAIVLGASAPGTPAKLIAKMHAKALDLPAAYILDMMGNEQLGQWLQLQPTEGTWPGIIFGVDDADIVFQAVGPAGKLPKKTTLNYAMQGLKLELGGTEFNAWATRNQVSQESAYFVKINGTPKTILFGPYAEDSQAELYVIHLQ